MGLTAALLAGGWAGLVAPILAHQSETLEAIRDTDHRLQRYEAIAASRDALEEQLSQLQARRAGTDRLLTGDTDALAAANLQELARATIERRGGQIRTLQALESTDLGPWRRIGVRVQFTGDLGALFAAAHDLERGLPLLLLDNVELQAAQRGAGRAREAAGEQPSPLTASFDVFGFVARSRES